MIKEELKQEAEESAKKFFGKPTDLVDLDNLRIFKNAYLASAGSREKLITYNGKSQSLRKWCEELNLKSSVVYSRLTKYKWSVKRALETKTK